MCREEAGTHVLSSATVPNATGILQRMALDPALGYMAVAAAFLAAVAVVAGLLRRDVLALRRPAALAKLAAGVLVAVLLAHGSQLAVAALGWQDDSWARPDGFFRLPLYVLALAYGPTPGLVAGLAYLGAAALGATPESAGPVLVVELAVLGWLSIFPSPRRHRWAGPADAAAAYLLAWGTTGLAVLAASGGVSAASVAAQHAGMLGGAALACLALFALGPRAYGRAFPESRVHAEADGDASVA